MLQEASAALVACGDVFAQPCIVARDGDRDGTPRCLMEAILSGVPVVSTYVGGIPDLVIDGETGLLVDKRDPAPLAGPIERLLEDPNLAHRLAARAAAHVRTHWCLPRCLGPLARRFAGYETAPTAGTIQ